MIFMTINLQGERDKNLTGKAMHKEVAGGIDTIEITCKECHVGKYWRILYQKDTGKWYEFSVTSVDEVHDEDGITYTVYAENSLKALAGEKIIEDRRGTQADGAEVVSVITGETTWQGVSDDVGVASYNFYHQNPLEAMDEVIKEFQCEYYTEISVQGAKVFRTLHLTKRVGQDAGKRFSFRKDMKMVKRTISEEDIVTRLYPYGKGEESGGGYGRRLSIKSLTDGKGYVENTEAQAAYGFEGRPFCATKVYQDVEDANELLRLAEEDLKTLSSPTITYETDVLALKSYGYDFEGVGVGDVCRFRDKELGLSFEGRVLEMVSDPDGIEPVELTMGNFKPSLADDFGSIRSDLGRLILKEGALDEMANPESFRKKLIDGLNEAFETATSYMFFDPESGLTIMDHPDQKKATWAMNLGSLGFRIASGKEENGEWRWATFGTGEGFTADQIVSGTILADMVRSGSLVSNDGKTVIDLEHGRINFGDQLSYSPEDGLKLKIVDEAIEDIEADLSKKADKDKIVTQINANPEGVQIAGENIELTGDTTVQGSFSVPGSALFGTINADYVNVKNLNADYITSGTLRRGVDNGSCSLPMSGSSSLYGSATDFHSGNSAFRFDYDANTFFVSGRIACTPTGNYHTLEQNGLSLQANGSFISIKPWGSTIRVDSDVPVEFLREVQIDNKLAVDYIKTKNRSVVICEDELHVRGDVRINGNLYIDGKQVTP